MQSTIPQTKRLNLEKSYLKKLETGAQKAGAIQLLRMINLHSQIVVTRKITDEFGNHDISFFDENWEKVS